MFPSCRRNNCAARTKLSDVSSTHQQGWIPSFSNIFTKSCTDTTNKDTTIVTTPDINAGSTHIHTPVKHITLLERRLCRTITHLPVSMSVWKKLRPPSGLSMFSLLSEFASSSLFGVNDCRPSEDLMSNVSPVLCIKHPVKAETRIVRQALANLFETGEGYC